MKKRILSMKNLFIMFLVVFSMCGVAVGLALSPKQSIPVSQSPVSSMEEPIVLNKPEDFTYSELDGNSVEVTGIVNVSAYARKNVKISVPSENSDGKKVAKIGDYAFAVTDDARYCITEITLPDTLEVIGNYAFANEFDDYEDRVEHDFTTITLPTNVKIIGSHAFYSQKNLQEVNISPESELQEIGDYAFSGLILKSYGSGRAYHFTSAPNISTFTIPKKVTKIGDYAFYMCEDLTTVNFASDSMLQEIGRYAFAGDVYESEHIDNRESDYYKYEFATNKISSITIPKSVITIKDYAFYGCGNLSELNFEQDSSLESIGDYAFAGSIYRSKRDFNASKSTYNKQENKISTITFPESLKSIGNGAFYICSNLSNVEFAPNSTLESIGSYAFGAITYYSSADASENNKQDPVSTKSSLKSFTIPESVQSLTFDILAEYNEQTKTYTDICEWTISNSSIEKTENYLYNNDTNTLLSCKEQDIPVAVQEKVQIIGNRAFYGVDLGSNPIALPETVTELKEKAFEGCGLSSITINAGLKTIGKSAFSAETISTAYSTKITSVTYNGTLESWLDIDFADAVANPLNAGATLTIGADSQTEITINKNVKPYAFYGCSSLTNVTLANPVTSIGEQAFYSANLTKITLNETLSSIGLKAFGDDYSNSTTKIKEVVFEGSIAQWLDIDFANGFANPLYNHASLTIGEQLIENVKTSKNIKSYAFFGYEKLKSVILEEGATSIGENAFYTNGYGVSLPILTVPESLTNVGANSFNGCNMVVAKSKAQSEELSAKTNSTALTYQIQITFNKTDGSQQVETKLYAKDLKWGLVEGVWTLGDSEMTLDEDNWTDGEQLYFRNLANFQTIWNSGVIKEDIEFNHVDIVNNIVDEKTKVGVSSQTGFLEGAASLSVEEISDKETLQTELGNAYIDGVAKLIKNITLTQVDNVRVSDARFILNEADFKDYYVCSYSYGSLSLKNPVDGKYDFGTSAPTIVLLKKGSGEVVTPTKPVEIHDNTGVFAAHVDAGFEENVTLSVDKITDASAIAANLGGLYTNDIKRLFVIQLKQGEAEFSGENVKISFDELLAYGFKVSVVEEGVEGKTLRTISAVDGKYTIDGTKATVVLTADSQQQDVPGQTENSASANMPLVIGLAVGMGVELIALIGICVYMIIKRKRNIM